MPKLVVDGPFSEAKELVVAHGPGRAPIGRGHYALVNGLRMYYELHGRGRPLVVLHAALSNIDSSFGGVLRTLASHRQVIAVEQQAHGRTADIDRPLSYEQMADDTAELLRQLGIRHVDVVGYSMGGGTALQLAVRHPGLARKLAVIAALYNNDAYRQESLRLLQRIDPMGSGWTTAYRLEFQRVAPKPEQWPAAVARMKEALGPSRGLSREHLRAIGADTLLVAAEDDEMLDCAQMADMCQLMRHARLEVCRGADHLSIIGRAAPLLPAFLEAPLRAD